MLGDGIKPGRTTAIRGKATAKPNRPRRVGLDAAEDHQKVLEHSLARAQARTQAPYRPQSRVMKARLAAAATKLQVDDKALLKETGWIYTSLYHEIQKGRGLELLNKLYSNVIGWNDDGQDDWEQQAVVFTVQLPMSRCKSIPTGFKTVRKGHLRPCASPDQSRSYSLTHSLTRNNTTRPTTPHSTSPHSPAA